jgi:hypothetical protein
MAQAEYVPSAICALIPDGSAQPSTNPIWVQRLIICVLAHRRRFRHVIALLVDLRFPRTGGLRHFAKGSAGRVA